MRRHEVPFGSRGSPFYDLLLGVIGITEVTVVAGGNAKPVDMGETTMAAFVDTLQPAIHAAAA